jgi:folate-binding protein YgfZ
MALPAPHDPPAHAAPLPGLAALRVSGGDRVAFLQGQLTQDTRQLLPEAALLAGWCTAQGRLLAVGWLFGTADACYWCVPEELANDLQRRLSMFVLRAQVSIDRAEGVVCGAWDAPDHPVGPAARLPVTPARWLWLAPGNATPTADAAAAARWCAADVASGIPTVAAATRDLFVPQMLNLDLLGAIGFAKGCYAGQEVVTRTQRLGRIGRRTFRYRLPDHAAPAPGTTLTREDGREIGRVLRACDTGDGAELLAVVQVAESAQSLWLAGTPARRLDPLPLPYAIPETGAG